MSSRPYASSPATWLRSVILCAVLGGAGLLVLQPAVRSVGAQESAQEAAQPAPPPGEIRFVGKNKMATAKSVFEQWRVKSANIDAANLGGSSVEIEIDVASLNTGIAKRDEHLRSADFFDVAKYPTALVRVHSVAPKEGAPPEQKLYTAKMDLDIHGVQKTRDIEFTMESLDPLKVRGEFILLRSEFGVGAPHKRLNPLSVEDEVRMSFEATLAPQG